MPKNVFSQFHCYYLVLVYFVDWNNDYFLSYSVNFENSLYMARIIAISFRNARYARFSSF